MDVSTSEYGVMLIAYGRDMQTHATLLLLNEPNTVMSSHLHYNSRCYLQAKQL